MRTRTRAAFVALPLVLSSSSLLLAAQATYPAEETAAIMEVIKRTTEAFNAHDAESFVEFYTPKATLVTVRGERMHGTAEMISGLGSIFATRAQNARLRNLDTSVTFLTPDVAVAHVLNELSGLHTPKGDLLAPHEELSIRVFVKADGVWRVAAFHNTIVQDKAPD